jgi:hypothetical protein
MPAAELEDVAGKEAIEQLTLTQKRLGDEQKAHNDFIALENARLEKEIAELEGKRPNLTKVRLAEALVDADRAAGLHPEMAIPIGESLGMLAAIMDCHVAVQEKHNAEYPKNPWTIDTDLRDMIGGPPTVMRKRRAKACAENGGELQK